MSLRESEALRRPARIRLSANTRPPDAARKSTVASLVIIGVLLFLVGYPIYLLFNMSLNVGDSAAIPAEELGLGNYAMLPDHLEWFFNSIIVALVSTTLATLAGCLLCWILYRTNVPGSKTLELLFTIPFPMGPLVGALAWSTLAAPPSGLLNQFIANLTGRDFDFLNAYSLQGIIFVSAIFEAPIAILMIGAAMQRMDPSLEEASMVLGSGTARTARKVTMPLMIPAVSSAAIFIFLSTLGEFAIPALLGPQAQFYTVTTAIYVLFHGYPANYALAAALGVTLTLLGGLILLVYSRFIKGRSFSVISGRTYRPRRSVRLGRAGGATLLAIEVAYAVIACVLPVGLIAFASMQSTHVLSWLPSDWTLANFKYVMFDLQTTRMAISNSLVLGVLTATVGVLIASTAAWIVHRTRARGRMVLEQVVMIPQTIPKLIFVVGLLWMLLTVPLHIYGTLAAVLLAYVIVFLPLGYRSMAGVVSQVDRSLEEAARVSGAGWMRASVTVNLPLLRPGLIAAWLLLFMISVREVTSSLFLSTAGTPILGPAIFNFWESGGLPRVSALVLVQAVVVCIALLLSRRFTDKNMSL